MSERVRYEVWFCEECKSAGVAAMDLRADVMSGANAVRSNHKQKSPECGNDVRILAEIGDELTDEVLRSEVYDGQYRKEHADNLALRAIATAAEKFDEAFTDWMENDVIEPLDEDLEQRKVMYAALHDLRSAFNEWRKEK